LLDIAGFIALFRFCRLQMPLSSNMYRDTGMGSDRLNDLGRYKDESVRAETEKQFQKHSTGLMAKWALSIRKSPTIIDNVPLAIIVAAYILAVYGVHALFGIDDRVVLKVCYDWLTSLTIVFCSLFILLHIGNKSYKKYFSARHLIGLVSVYLLGPLFVSAFASFKQTIPLIHHFSWDVPLMRFDYFLHFGHHPWSLLKPILDFPWAIRFIDSMYMLWFIFLVIFCLWMAWTKRRHLRLCFIISTLLVWSLVGSFLGTVFSSAGPCYYSQVVLTDNDPFAPLMSKLAAINQEAPLWAIKNQVGLWEAKLHGTWLPFGGISAMPSVHLAMATLFTLLAFEVHKWLGVFFSGYTLIMQIGSVILGWHYAVDGYAGVVLACMIWYVVRRTIKWKLPFRDVLVDVSAKHPE
jgi:hypothetical protein